MSQISASKAQCSGPWQPLPGTRRSRCPLLSRCLLLLATTACVASRAALADRLPPSLGHEDAIANRIVDEPGTPYSQSWPNTVAVCAVCKLESNANVKEWLDYYKHLGVDKIYLQENDSASLLTDMLAPYIASGFLHHELHEGPVNPGQTLWYNACAQRAAEEKMSWVMFLDLDEFAVVLHEQKAVTTPGALKAVLAHRFRYNAAVSLQWVLFGSNEHVTRPEGGQLRGYSRCTGVLSREMKCIANAYWLTPDQAFDTGPGRTDNHVHQCNVLPGATVVLGNGDPVKTFKLVADKTGTRFSYTAHLPFDTHEEFQTNVTDSHSIVLFHYVTRSREEFVERKATMIGSGKYGMEFRNMTMAAEAGGPGANLSQAEMFADFEARHEFDKDDAICKQGAAIAEAAGLA